MNKKNIGFHMVLVVHKIDIIGKILITDVTITCSWSLNIGKEEKVCVWAKWPIRLALTSGVLSIKLRVVFSRNISEWPLQRLKCGPFYLASSALNIRPSHLPTWLGFNYFSLLQNEVTWLVNINILADVVKLHCKSSTKKSILLQCLFW